MDATQEEIRARVLRLRKLFGWPQFRLANAAGIHRTRLSLFENGYINLGADQIVRLETALVEGFEHRRSELDQAAAEICRA